MIWGAGSVNGLLEIWLCGLCVCKSDVMCVQEGSDARVQELLKAVDKQYSLRGHQRLFAH